MFATFEEFIKTQVSDCRAHGPRAVLDLHQARIGNTWGAHDRSADVVYLYDCVVTPPGDLSLLAAPLRDRGAWILVLMDAEARKRP